MTRRQRIPYSIIGPNSSSVLRYMLQSPESLLGSSWYSVPWGMRCLPGLIIPYHPTPPVSAAGGLFFDLERSRPDIAQASAILVSRMEPGQHHTGAPAAYCFDIHREGPWPLARHHGQLIGDK